VIYVEAGDEKSVLACFEEGLRHPKLVAEVAHLSMIASRKLQLAAEGSGVIGIALRRWRRQFDAAEFVQPTAATTRLRVSALPSTPLPVPGVGRARWRPELLRLLLGQAGTIRVFKPRPSGRAIQQKGRGRVRRSLIAPRSKPTPATSARSEFAARQAIGRAVTP
jgi:protein ImuA